jgi:hypothetical protein
LTVFREGSTDGGTGQVGIVPELVSFNKPFIREAINIQLSECLNRPVFQQTRIFFPIFFPNPSALNKPNLANPLHLPGPHTQPCRGDSPRLALTSILRDWLLP